MSVTKTKIGGSSKGRKVGRKRKAQPKEVRRTLAGKIGVRLAELAKDANMSAAQLADAIGKDVDTVHAYFAGKASPKVNDWPTVAKALGVPLRELLPNE